jgi:hypothetical protein
LKLKGAALVGGDDFDRLLSRDRATNAGDCADPEIA